MLFDSLIVLVLSHWVHPILSHWFHPILSHLVHPVLSHWLHPILSHLVHPILSHLVHPILSQLVHPILSHWVYPILSHWVYPILSHWVSYQPRLFIAKCCCQPRWRPPTCWRWMWRWHKILMSEVAPSTAHQTLLYESSLRRTFSAPGPGMVLFSVPCGMPGNGSAIIHAHSSSRLIIWGPSDPSQIFT